MEDPSITRTVTCGEQIRVSAEDSTLYKYYFIPEEDGYNAAYHDPKPESDDNSDPGSGKWYIYEPNKMPLTFTVTQGEETFTGTALELSLKYGYSFSVSGTVSEQMKAHWEAGHTYTVTCSFMGKETDIEIRILPPPSAGSTESGVLEISRVS